ncbi:uncharacterized protein TNCV_3813881 [Trichonephila clavipes]|nr:uncharacterized protein TNCV_3813881 [Trichonephila clavipes]
MIPAYNKKRYAAFPSETGIHFRRKFDFFPEEDTTKSYSGFEPDPTQLQAEAHSHHTGWATSRDKSGERAAVEEAENDVGSLEQLLLYADENYLAGKLPLGDYLGKVLHGVDECHQLNGSARKGRLDLGFASARCLKIVCGTIATPTSARIVERVTVGSTSACRTIFRTSLLVGFLVTPDSVFHTWVPSRVHCSPQYLTAHYERSTWPATRRVDQPAVLIPMIRHL